VNDEQVTLISPVDSLATNFQPQLFLDGYEDGNPGLVMVATSPGLSVITLGLRVQSTDMLARGSNVQFPFL